MIPLLGNALFAVFKSLVLKLLAQELLEKLLIELAEYMASKTDNQLDDKCVSLIKEQLGKK